MFSLRQVSISASVVFILLTGILMYFAVRASNEQHAWTSHHVELARIIDRCPGQHADVRAALADGRLQIDEGRELIYACALESIRDAVEDG